MHHSSLLCDIVCLSSIMAIACTQIHHFDQAPRQDFSHRGKVPLAEANRIARTINIRWSSLCHAINICPSCCPWSRFIAFSSTLTYLRTLYIFIAETTNAPLNSNLSSLSENLQSQILNMFIHGLNNRRFAFAHFDIVSRTSFFFICALFHISFAHDNNCLIK